MNLSQAFQSVDLNQYSQDARSHTLLVFLVTLSSLFLLQSVREGSRRNWIRYVVTSTLAIYAHSFAVFVLVAHWVSLLFLPRRQAPSRRFVPTTAAIGLLALPMVLFLLRSLLFPGKFARHT